MLVCLKAKTGRTCSGCASAGRVLRLAHARDARRGDVLTRVHALAQGWSGVRRWPFHVKEVTEQRPRTLRSTIRDRYGQSGPSYRDTRLNA